MRAWLFAALCLAAGAAAQEPSLLWLHQDVSGNGTAWRVRTFLVDPHEAVAVYSRSPLSREGTNLLYSYQGDGLPPIPVGLADGLERFLETHYQEVSNLGPGSCVTSPGVTAEILCGARCNMPWTQACDIAATTLTVSCPGSCTSGAGCLRTPQVVTYYHARSCCVPCILSTNCPSAGVRCQGPALSFVSTGALCICPGSGCAVAGPGHPGGSPPLTCVTQPRIRSVFRLSFQNVPLPATSLLVIGPCDPGPRVLSAGTLCLPVNLWVVPVYGRTTTASPAVFDIPIANNPTLVGTIVCAQGAFPEASGCWRSTDAVVVTVMP